MSGPSSKRTPLDGRLVTTGYLDWRDPSAKLTLDGIFGVRDGAFSRATGFEDHEIPKGVGGIYAQDNLAQTTYLFTKVIEPASSEEQIVSAIPFSRQKAGYDYPISAWSSLKPVDDESWCYWRAGVFPPEFRQHGVHFHELACGVLMLAAGSVPKLEAFVAPNFELLPKLMSHFGFVKLDERVACRFPSTTDPAGPPVEVELTRIVLEINEATVRKAWQRLKLIRAYWQSRGAHVDYDVFLHQAFGKLGLDFDRGDKYPVVPRGIEALSLRHLFADNGASATARIA